MVQFGDSTFRMYARNSGVWNEYTESGFLSPIVTLSSSVKLEKNAKSYTPPASKISTVAATDSGYSSSQTFTTSNSNITEWKVWKINSINKTIEIISSIPTATSLKLCGYSGYNNSINIMNSICSTLYSNSNKGISARSMNETDYNNKDTTLGGSIINKRNCFLASCRIVDYLGYNNYDIRSLSSGGINDAMVRMLAGNSGVGTDYTQSNNLSPIVTLSSSVKLIKNSNGIWVVQ